jgi:lactate dehydrogenase-like 2-hydroxyacid dehydrogenase
MMGAQVTGKTLGLIGMGRIGRAVARRAHFGFDMEVLFHDPFPPSAEDAEALGARACDTVEEVLERADFVSLHTPGGAATRHLMNAGRLARMKPGAFLINSSRGDVIDEAALVAALRKGTIAGAGLDVYEGEPEVSPELIAMENVVLLPHLGSATTETRVAMGMKVLDNAEAFFAGETPPNRVA